MLAFTPVPPAARQQLGAVESILLALGVINVLVILIVNPWRVDRVPDRFPKIVQDAAIIALFALFVTIVLPDKALATTAVGAVIVGLALQDTLGNLFAGLAIQVERPFRVGQWVTIGGRDGLVTEITWRATKIRTKAGNLVIVPNSALAKDTVTNYSEPTLDLRLEVEVSASYHAAPNVVKAVIRDALRDALLLVREREPEVLLVDFAGSGMTYRVRFWISDFAADERAKDYVRSTIYYAFQRHGVTIPFPIEVQMSTEDAGLAPPRVTTPPQALASIAMFAALGDDERQALLEAARRVVYGAGEAIVRQGDSANSLFVILSGEAAVTLDNAEGQLARLGVSDVFGEMSLLTGEPRTATVTALADCDLLEIDAEGFRRVLLAHPSALERVTTAALSRRQELEWHRDTHAAAVATVDSGPSLLARVRRFLRLSS